MRTDEYFAPVEVVDKETLREALGYDIDTVAYVDPLDEFERRMQERERANRCRREVLEQVLQWRSPWIVSRCHRCSSSTYIDTGLCTYCTIAPYPPEFVTYNAYIESMAHERAERYGDVPERVNFTKVFADYHGICYLCDEPIDIAVPRMSLLGLNFDHIIPLYYGGHHAAWNFAPTHSSCNQAKSALISPTLVRTAMQAYTHAFGEAVAEAMYTKIAETVQRAVPDDGREMNTYEVLRLSELLYTHPRVASILRQSFERKVVELCAILQRNDVTIETCWAVQDEYRILKRSA